MQDITFKILSGINSGAEFSLTAGSYIVGKGSDAFIVLNDNTLKDHHLKIEITQEGEIFIEPADGKCFIDCTEINIKTKLNPGSFLTFGLNDLTVFAENDDVNSLLEKLNALKQDFLSKQVPIKAEEQTDVDKSIKETSQEIAKDLKDKLQNIVPLEGETKEAVKDLKSLFGSAKLTISIIVGALILCALLFMLIFSGAKVIGSNVGEIQSFLEKHNVENILVKNNYGYVKASGIVQTQAQKDEILSNLPSINEALVVNINTYDELLQDIQRGFFLKGATVLPVFDGKDKVNLYGYVKDEFVEADLMASVLSLFDYKLELVPNFVYRNKLEPQLKRIGAKYGLNSVNYVYTSMDVGYYSRLNLLANRNFLLMQQEIAEFVKSPVSLLTINELESKIMAISANSHDLTEHYDDDKKRLAAAFKDAARKNILIARNPSGTYRTVLSANNLDPAGSQNGIPFASLTAPSSGREYSQGNYSGNGGNSSNHYTSNNHYAFSGSNGNGVTVTGAPGTSGADGIVFNNNGAGGDALGVSNNGNGDGRVTSSHSNAAINANNSGDGQGQNLANQNADVSSITNHKNFNNVDTKNEQNSSERTIINNERSDERQPGQAYDLNTQEDFGLNLQGYEFVDLPELDHEIMGVTLKPLRFVTLRSGTKVFEGGLLPSGHRVKRIYIDKLILTLAQGGDAVYELK